MNKISLSIFLILVLAFLPSLPFENAYPHGFPESPHINYINDFFVLKTPNDIIPIWMYNNVNHVTTFIFDSNHNSISFKIPLGLGSNSSNDFIASIRIPESFATYTTDEGFNGYVNDISVSKKSFIVDPYSLEDSNLVFFILDKNELERINLLNPNGSKIMEFKITLPIVHKKLSYYEIERENPNSPRKQFRNNVLQDVICPEKYQLVFRARDGASACVTEQTAQDLVARKWSGEKFPIRIVTDKYAYKTNESIMIIMSNVGTKILQSETTHVGFSIYDENNKRICTWNGINLGIGKFIQGEIVIHMLDSKNGCRDDGTGVTRYKLESGSYEIRADNLIGFGGKRDYHGPITEFRVLDK